TTAQGPHQGATMTTSPRRLVSLGRLALAAVALLILLAVVLLASGRNFTGYPLTYTYRKLFWGDSTVGDKFRFPSRALTASPQPYHFRTPADAQAARQILQATSGSGDFERMLADQGTEALLVLHGDTLLYEGYFNGTQRDTLLTSFSVAKSISSALVGIALGEGKLHSLNDPITRYLPELAARDPRFAQITLRDLMTMTSGIQYVDRGPRFDSDASLTYIYPDLRELCLQRTRMDDTPGVHWLYNTYNPILMGIILERATGMSVTAYTQEKLWGPLGMEYAGSWSVDQEPGGMEKMESGFNARAIDFAKFGQLILDGGAWQGRQVLPRSWVAESTTADPARDHPGYYRPGSSFYQWTPPGEQGYYAYWWWGWHEPDGRVSFAANGKHGQFIFISPADRVVIVRNGTRIGRPGREWFAWFQRAAHAIGAQNVQ
ncbi:MAG TPA: serine hydrolase, partial [bacterium]|nr:serine hydrolase [bacterium]